MINLKIDPEFQSQIPPLTDDEFKQLEENILKEGKLISPLIVWGNTLVDGHNRYEIVQKHPEISFSTMPLLFESREEVLAWICKNQLGRRNLTPEQKKFLIGKQYSVEHRKPGGNGNNQHTAAAKKTAPEELCQFDTIPPTATEANMKYDERACKFNMDTGCVELLLRDGRMISIDCTGVEDALDVTMAQRSELDYLIYNDPLGYADLILNGDPEKYLKNVNGSHGLED